MYHVFRIINVATRRQYVGVLRNNDPTFGVRPTPLIEAANGYNTILTAPWLPPELHDDIRTHGLQCFVLESLQATPAKHLAHYYKRQYLGALMGINAPVYNRRGQPTGP